ncbi:zinc ribbon domain-containing protein [Delftia sp. DLF01]|uniref:zinc-ribbon domain-containing protein n=1 Tax=Delftia sp. DLF01 TaxID=2769279 RepID=UPI00178111B7|nr:zinc-ribbon domain-containing protein [Delftia sp. DLF01]MBD9583585.1 zinc ribbon domain-containing protein [Delftia sp. DLF01]
MALIACEECGKMVSDKAAACPQCGAPIAGAPSSAPVAPPSEQKGSIWKWIIGLPVGLFVILFLVGSCIGNTPEGKEKRRQRDVIELCRKEQARQSLEPDAARLAASTCEQLERDFRARFGSSP